MCLPKAPTAPPPAAAPNAINPVLTNMYDPESGEILEKGAISKKAKGTSQLKVDLDPVVSTMDKGAGLQITK